MRLVRAIIYDADAPNLYEQIYNVKVNHHRSLEENEPTKIPLIQLLAIREKEDWNIKAKDMHNK